MLDPSSSRSASAPDSNIRCAHSVTMEGSTGASALMGPQTYGWAQVQNIRRDPFEQSVGEEQKSVLSVGGALASPSTAYLYNWNMLPVGQQLWLKELESYIAFPPLQDPETYNLVQVMEQVKKMGNRVPAERPASPVGRHPSQHLTAAQRVADQRRSRTTTMAMLIRPVMRPPTLNAMDGSRQCLAQLGARGL